jgi:hypothetical protein
MIAPQKFEFLVNSRHGIPGITTLPAAGFRRAKSAIAGWPGYQPTPLLTLPGIADVAAVRIKHEGSRFGLGSFKALGGAYAVANLLTAELSRRRVAPSRRPRRDVCGPGRRAIPERHTRRHCHLRDRRQSRPLGCLGGGTVSLPLRYLCA